MAVKLTICMLVIAFACTCSEAAQRPSQTNAVQGIAPDAVMAHLEAANWSCDRRKTCSKIGSCEEAMWYLNNCSWGGKLDGDSMGKPCETLCGQDS